MPTEDETTTTETTETETTETEANAESTETTTETVKATETLIGGDDDKGQAEATGAKVEIVIPEGVEVNQDSLGEFTVAAQSLGLKSEGAQQLYNLYLKEHTSFLESEEKAFEETQQKWLEAVKADKEIGGADYLAKAQSANAALKRVASDEFMVLVKDMGLSNHPELVRLGYKLHTLLSEDTVKDGRASATPVNSVEASLRKEYASMFKDGA